MAEDLCRKEKLVTIVKQKINQFHGWFYLAKQKGNLSRQEKVHLIPQKKEQKSLQLIQYSRITALLYGMEKTFISIFTITFGPATTASLVLTFFIRLPFLSPAIQRHVAEENTKKWRIIIKGLAKRVENYTKEKKIHFFVIFHRRLSRNLHNENSSLAPRHPEHCWLMMNNFTAAFRRKKS